MLPHAKHGFHGDDPLPIYVVYVSEVSDPSSGKDPIDWMLLTNKRVSTYDDAWRVVEWYERRWVIEEYHKAMKTGGHQNRKHDKPPDWLVLWRGWTKLQYLTDGYLTAKKCG